MKFFLLTALSATASVFAQTVIDELVSVTVNGIAYTVDVPIAIPTPTATSQYLTTVAVALQLNYYIPTISQTPASLNALSVLQSAVCVFSDARYCQSGMPTGAPSIVAASLTTVTVTALISGSQVLTVGPYVPGLIATTTVLATPTFVGSSTISTISSTGAVVIVVAPSGSGFVTRTTTVPVGVVTSTINSITTTTVPVVGVATTTISSIATTTALTSSPVVVVTTTLLTSSSPAVTTITTTQNTASGVGITTISTVAIAATTAAPPVLTSHALAAATHAPVIVGGLAAGLIACFAF